MFKKIFDKGIFNSLNFDNAPKVCKEMENKRIDMTALEFMCAVPIIVKALDLSKKEQMGAIAFASAIVSLNTNEEGKKCLGKPLMEFKNDLLAEFAQTEIPPENTAQDEEPKKDEPAADAEQAEHAEPFFSSISWKPSAIIPCSFSCFLCLACILQSE